jgi:hypothetical protein
MRDKVLRRSTENNNALLHAITVAITFAARLEPDDRQRKLARRKLLERIIQQIRKIAREGISRRDGGKYNR